MYEAAEPHQAHMEELETSDLGESLRSIFLDSDYNDDQGKGVVMNDQGAGGFMNTTSYLDVVEGGSMMGAGVVSFLPATNWTGSWEITQLDRYNKALDQSYFYSMSIVIPSGLICNVFAICIFTLSNSLR